MNILQHIPCMFKQGYFLMTRNVMESRITGKNRILTLKTCEWCGYVFVDIAKNQDPKTIGEAKFIEKTFPGNWKGGLQN